MEEDSLLDEECLALESILEDKFTRLQPNRIRLIIAPEGAEEGSPGWVPLYLELTVPADYPESAPQPDLSNVNNAPYAPAVKQKAIAEMLQQMEGQLGECMLYTLAEWAKEQLPGWLEQSVVERSTPAASGTADAALSPAAGKEESQLKGLTKAQKRRHFDKFGAAEEKPRGWNWVDILSHLSKGPVRTEGIAA